MNMDPNWFYSSLAQSAASIIGLLGAILVSRLLDHLGQVRTSKSRLVDDFVECRQGIHDQLTSVEAYAHELQKRVEQLRAAATAGTPEVEFNSGLQCGHLTLHFGKVNVEELASHEKRLEFCRKITEIVKPVFAWDMLKASDIVSCTVQLRKLESTLPLRETVDVVSSMAVPLRTLARQIESHNSSLLPSSTNFLLIILGWFSLFGVMIPLRYVWGGIYKDLLSAAFLVGLLALFAYFVVLIREIRQAGDLRLPDRSRWGNGLNG